MNDIGIANIRMKFSPEIIIQIELRHSHGLSPEQLRQTIYEQRLVNNDGQELSISEIQEVSTIQDPGGFRTKVTCKARAHQKFVGSKWHLAESWEGFREGSSFIAEEDIGEYIKGLFVDGKRRLVPKEVIKV